MSSLAIIPARGGSVRIPGKNKKPFLGKPIILYSIEAALTSGIFDEVMVSTDDPEIAAISKEHGANVPFLRSSETSDNYSTLADVLIEVLSEYKELNREFDTVCCLLPTAPFISSKKLNEAFDLLIKGGFDAIFPVVEFSFPIQRSLELNNTGKVKMVWPEYLSTRSQDLPARYHDAGQFYFLKNSAFLKEKKLYVNNAGSIVYSALQVQDIDSEVDWMLAEIKFKLLKDEEENSI